MWYKGHKGHKRHKRHERHEWHKGRCIVGANLKVGKTAPTLAYLSTPLTPQTPFAPWGFSPQAKRLLSFF